MGEEQTLQMKGLLKVKKSLLATTIAIIHFLK